MKKSIFTLLIIMGLGSAYADGYDYPYLAFEDQNGAVQTVAVEALVLTVQNGQIVATNSDGSQTFTLTDLSKMYFSTTGSGTTAIQAVSPQGETAGEFSASAQQPVEVYTMTGTKLGQFENLNTARTSLVKGIYVVKSASQTFKIAVQ